jgi:hypothetical protein
VQPTVLVRGSVKAASPATGVIRDHDSTMLVFVVRSAWCAFSFDAQLPPALARLNGNLASAMRG